MFSKLFGRTDERTAESLEGPFFKVVQKDGRDFHFADLRMEPNCIVTVRANKNDLSSYLMATFEPGEAIATGGWCDGARLIAVRGRPVRKHDDPRFAMFDRLYVEADLPSYLAFGDNGEAVEHFLNELQRRGQPDTDDRIPATAWHDCEVFLRAQQHEPNSEHTVRGAWDAAYALARKTSSRAACDMASDIAKDLAAKAAHVSEPADERDRLAPDSAEWGELDKTVVLRIQGFTVFPGFHMGESLNVAAGLVAERAGLAIVMQRHLAPELFDALTEPMRRFVDPAMLGCLKPTSAKT